MRKQYMRAAMAMALAALPACCLAADAPIEPPPVPAMTDVALARGGLLQGQIVDAKGAPMKAAQVSIWHENQQVAKTVSDNNGQFRVAGLRGGVHLVVAGQNSSAYRLWTSDAAPPNASTGTVVMPGETVVRGQNGYPIAGNIIRSPILWGALGYTAGHIIGFNSGIDRTPSSP